jgi:hypothetical protein
VVFKGGTLTISGCGLTLNSGFLTGTLADGAMISTQTSGVTSSNLQNGC